MAVWRVNLGVAADSSPNLQPPSPFPGKVELDGSIQPPVQPTEAPRVVQPAPVIPVTAPSGQLPNEVIAWDGEQKEATVKLGEVEAHFKFCLTNVSPGEVTILNVATSCGCTAAHLPPMPWKLVPGTNGEINVTMNVAGKSGTVFKTVTVSTDKGNKTLMVKSIIAAPPAGGVAMDGRARNQQLALADRQAVFKGDCASCHVAPAAGKMGKELYTTACAICHEAEHRATMVSDLHNLKQEMGRELWQIWITYGKPGSLMPAFAKSQGGPLTDEQIRSLVDYLVKAMPSKAAPVAAKAAPKIN